MDLKNYTTRMTNSQNDRIYMATEDGILLCLRELGKVAPTPLRDPSLPKFGTTPQEIYEMNQAKEEKEAAKPKAEKPEAEAPAEPK